MFGVVGSVSGRDSFGLGVRSKGGYLHVLFSARVQALTFRGFVLDSVLRRSGLFEWPNIIPVHSLRKTENCKPHVNWQKWVRLYYYVMNAVCGIRPDTINNHSTHLVEMRSSVEQVEKSIVAVVFLLIDLRKFSLSALSASLET
ncbi:hypothetical protein TNCV_2689681 [Trichonephila clavipes]|uniref:Uncharacterized protein n=1 Tax=Trichonephila clavipes TaxID=2585209 RepID=A0A8X6VYK0_TRICX|nr:hypothetical protein TNCV_2689681 [Trichonephila clavipes]